MPKFQTLAPTIHITCINGHQNDKEMPSVFIPGDLKCPECFSGVVTIVWAGMKPHTIEGVEENVR